MHDNGSPGSYVYGLFPFTSNTCSKLVLYMGYWDDNVQIYVNNTLKYSGRRKETNTIIDITSCLTTSLCEIKVVSTDMYFPDGSISVSAITTK